MPDDLPGLDPEAFEDAEAAEALRVDIEGFEGPLDLLLALARRQRVDLRRISILQLAERYLAFVAEARRLRIELAADYLVMAAWLAFLKSRLLLPPPHEDGPSGDELAARLQARLERLETIRRAAARLMARDQLGREVFPRGAPEPVVTDVATEWGATVADLIRAYARLGAREAKSPLRMRPPPILSVDAAYARLRALLGDLPDWTELAGFLPEDWAATPGRRRSAIASVFAASLELARRGEIELRQDAPFAPIRLRPRGGPA
jgi:segregation and condensation protein A